MYNFSLYVFFLFCMNVWFLIICCFHFAMIFADINKKLITFQRLSFNDYELQNSCRESAYGETLQSVSQHVEVLLLISSLCVSSPHKILQNTDIHHGNITESTFSLRGVKDGRDFFFFFSWRASKKFLEDYKRVSTKPAVEEEFRALDCSCQTKAVEGRSATFSTTGQSKIL